MMPLLLPSPNNDGFFVAWEGEGGRRRDRVEWRFDHEQLVNWATLESVSSSERIFEKPKTTVGRRSNWSRSQESWWCGFSPNWNLILLFLFFFSSTPGFLGKSSLHAFHSNLDSWSLPLCRREVVQSACFHSFVRSHFLLYWIFLVHHPSRGV